MVAKTTAGFSSRVTTFIVAVLALVATLVGVNPAGASHYTNTKELSATTNVGAAIAWSKEVFATSASEVLLGRDDDFADSLSSGSMQNGRPLLLTNKQTLSPETSAELDRLKPGIVNIMGGASAVSVAIENDLKSRSYVQEVRRFSGPTRIETAIDVARRSQPAATSAIIAAAFGPADGDSTRAFADSIAAGGWAADGAIPVLLTETARLTTSTKNYLRTATGIINVFVVGGTSAVSDAVIAELREINKTVKRVSGATRFDTAVAIAKERGFADASKASDVIMTEGQAANAWAAGFAAAAYARANDAPIVLSNGATIPTPTRTYLAPSGGAAGTVLVCSPGTTSAACDSATEAMGHAAISGNAPLLLSVTKGVSVQGSTPISFKFSEPVAAQVTGNNFRIYTFDALQVTATSAARHTANQDVVVANFPTADVTLSTVAAVAYDAVRALSSGTQNPEGSASLGSYTRAAGDSRAPNLASFQRTSGSDATSPPGADDLIWEVQFTFDKALTECGAQNKYVLVRDDVDATGEVEIASYDGDGGGNAQISSDRLKCTAEFTVSADMTWGKVARGYVRENAAQGAGYSGPPSSVSASGTLGPDLTGITVNVASGLATFIFDTSLATSNPTPNLFKIYNSFGRTDVALTATLATQTDRINVTFQPGVLGNVIVGGAVEKGAVTSAVNPLETPPTARSNAPGEIGRAATFNGNTAGPALTSVARTTSNANAVTIVFTFANAVAKTSGSFVVYSETGARQLLTGNTCSVDPSDGKKVNCNAGSNETAVFNAMRAAKRGGVTYDAVRPAGQASTGTGSPGHEGSAPIA